MPRNLVWLSYDLGVQGDYEGLYAWLDAHEAKECGDGLAAFRFEYSGDLLASLKSELSAAVSLDKRSRLYVIRLEHGSMKGKFLVGKRKNAPWIGFGPARGEEEEDAT